jgi:formylglycine-generating enzyme required for sulfatase activity
LANRPVVYVSWFDAARMANWMMNGQGSSSTETGAYTLNGANSGIIVANAGAQVYIPTENEWYKAAYYNGGTSTYSLYPNGQDRITYVDANYSWSVDFASSTDVGTYNHAPSFYGTFDQGGNVWEFNDAEIGGSSRGLRGGSRYSFGYDLRASMHSSRIPSSEYNDAGFRLASVPEPSAMLLTMLASNMMLIRRKR